MTNFRLLKLSLILLVFGSTINKAQTIDSVGVSITAVQIGNSAIDKSEWKSLSVKKDLPLYISFETTRDIKKQVFYKVFLDGNLLSANLLDNYISVNDLSTGTHVLKIIPAIVLGNEGIPLLIPFSVTDEKPIAASQKEDSGSILFSSPVVTYCIGGLILLQFGIIIILLIRNKPDAKSHSLKKEKELLSSKAHDQTLQELISLKQTLTRLKEDLKLQQESNDHLTKQLKEVNNNIQDLERANLHLVGQKEKLEESKYKIEILHSQKEDMFAMAIHDIKNPASAIRGYIELLNSYDLNANEQQEIMGSLVASSEDIVKLSQDMCTILAKAMPEPKLNFSKHAINEVIDTVVNQNASYSKAKKVKLVKKTADDLPELNIDLEKIEEVIDNLVNNAIKFAPPDATVEIVSYLKDENKRSVVVEIRDDGVGLTEDDLRRSFQKGAMLSAKPTGLEKSSGLGLWIVKKIIDEHGGKVWVESKIGIGSKFAFEIPVE